MGANEVREIINNLQAVRIKAQGVDEWLANMFEPRFNKFEQIGQKAAWANGVFKPIGEIP